MQYHQNLSHPALVYKVKYPIQVSDMYTTDILQVNDMYVTHVEPEMFFLMKIVIPRIMIYWQDIAYALQYDISTVQEIRVKEDPKQCCQELLEDWLSTSNGARPKVWSTLLNALREVHDLSRITKDIIVEVNQLEPSNTHQGKNISYTCPFYL